MVNFYTIWLLSIMSKPRINYYKRLQNNVDEKRGKNASRKATATPYPADVVF